MTLQSKIIELLAERPDLTSNEIAEVIGIKLSSAKVMLCKMAKAKEGQSPKILRRKELKREKMAGPANQYVYRNA
jgi:DNA-binding MarR family transcriptional regulator